MCGSLDAHRPTAKPHKTSNCDHKPGGRRGGWTVAKVRHFHIFRDCVCATRHIPDVTHKNTSSISVGTKSRLQNKTVGHSRLKQFGKPIIR